MALPNPFKKNKPPAPPLEPVNERKQFVEKQHKELEGEYQKKVFIERYSRRIAIASIVVIGALFAGVAVWLSFDSIVNFFSPKEEPVVIVDKPPEDFAITPKDVKVVPSGIEDRFDVFARLENNNREWGVAELLYTFKLLNSAGAVIGEKSGNTYVLPGEQRSLIEVNVFTSDTPARVEITVDPQKVQRLKQDTRLDFSFPALSYSERIGKGQVRGTIKNETPFAFDQIDLDVIVFNRQNEIIALNKTNLNALTSGEERDFIALWPESLGSNLQVQVEPHVNVFLSSSFLNVYSNGAQLDF